MVSPVTPNLHLLWERLKAAMMRNTRGVLGVMVSRWRGHSGQDNAHSRITARLLLLLLCHYMPRCWVLLPALVLSLNCTAVAAPTAAQQQRQQQCGGAVVLWCGVLLESFQCQEDCHLEGPLLHPVMLLFWVKRWFNLFSNSFVNYTWQIMAFHNIQK